MLSHRPNVNRTKRTNLPDVGVSVLAAAVIASKACVVGGASVVVGTLVAVEGAQAGTLAEAKI